MQLMQPKCPLFGDTRSNDKMMLAFSKRTELKPYLCMAKIISWILNQIWTQKILDWDRQALLLATAQKLLTFNF